MSLQEPRKILMPVDEEGAVRQMEVEAFRQLAESMKAINVDLRDVRERLIRIESNQLDRTVKEHSDRIAVLEREKSERAGATGLLSIVMKSPALGWLVGAAITAWAVLTGKVHP